MKKIIVVGSGAGGAAAAKEFLPGNDVTILEAGGEFRPCPVNLSLPRMIKRAGLLFDERQIRWLFSPMRVSQTAPNMVLVRSVGTGGTTTISTGNALRLDHDLKALGIDLDEEFEELGRSVPITADHASRWRPSTRDLFRICREMKLDPEPMPKMGKYEQCRNCGRCVLGCPFGVKWDSRAFLGDSVAAGAKLFLRTKAERVVIRNGIAEGVIARAGLRRRFFPADVVILAAGGLGTPAILDSSGIRCEPRLFVDPVLCIAAVVPGARQSSEMPMPFFVRKDRYIISPYFDLLSYFFNKSWKTDPGDILSLMIKLADESAGFVEGGRIRKSLTPGDERVLEEAVALCEDVFSRLGVKKEKLFRGTVNAGHPGGMLPLSAREARSLRPSRLPANVFVADATILPASLGAPPILTIMALAKKVARAARA